ASAAVLLASDLVMAAILFRCGRQAHRAAHARQHSRHWGSALPCGPVLLSVPCPTPWGMPRTAGALMPMIRSVLRKNLWLVLAVAALPAYAGTSRIYITNSAGDA